MPQFPWNKFSPLCIVSDNLTWVGGCPFPCLISCLWSQILYKKTDWINMPVWSPGPHIFLTSMGDAFRALRHRLEWDLSGHIHDSILASVSDFILGGSKITADDDCSHEIKRRLLLGRKVMTNLYSIFGVGNGTPLQYSCFGKSHGQRNLGYSPWCHKSQTAEQLNLPNLQMTVGFVTMVVIL